MLRASFEISVLAAVEMSLISTFLTEARQLNLRARLSHLAELYYMKVQVSWMLKTEGSSFEAKHAFLVSMDQRLVPESNPIILGQSSVKDYISRRYI